MSKKETMMFVFLIGLGSAGIAEAAFMDFGATGGGANLSDVNQIAPDTTITLAYSTTGTDDPFAVCVSGPGCIFGWTGALSTTGTLQISGYDPTGNTNTASGAGETSCDGSFLPASSCQTTGGDAADGEVGTNIIMFSLTLTGGSIGDQLLYTGDFTLSDFSSHDVQGQALATVVPEPGTAALFGAGFMALGLARRRV